MRVILPFSFSCFVVLLHNDYWFILGHLCFIKKKKKKKNLFDLFYLHPIFAYTLKCFLFVFVCFRFFLFLFKQTPHLLSIFSLTFPPFLFLLLSNTKFLEQHSQHLFHPNLSCHLSQTSPCQPQLKKRVSSCGCCGCILVVLVVLVVVIVVVIVVVVAFVFVLLFLSHFWSCWLTSSAANSTWEKEEERFKYSFKCSLHSSK